MQPGRRRVPNITPAKNGIEGWDKDDILSLLQLGMLPNFDNVQGMMADVIDGHGGAPGYAKAPEADLKAIAEYLIQVPVIDNGDEHN